MANKRIGSIGAAGRDSAPVPRSARERELTSRFADAFVAVDTDRLVALLTDDAWLTMPPEPLEYQGHAAIAEFYLTDPGGGPAWSGWYPPAPTTSPQSTHSAERARTRRSRTRSPQPPGRAQARRLRRSGVLTPAPGPK
jgi:hypothetical protein